MVRTFAAWTKIVKRSLLPLAIPTTALGQNASATSVGQIEQIIVTDQKREQSLNTVGISIIADTADVFQERGINSVADNLSARF